MAKQALKPGNAKQFVGVLVLVAVVGVGGLGYALTSGGPKAITVDPAIKAGPAEGHMLGSADAPVVAMEFGDFECPGCGQFANVTEPDVRARLVNTGIVAFYFYDFPLSQHKNTWTAHMAAACADEQGKFWGMHDRLYGGQLEWSGEVTGNPVKVMSRYAADLGMDVNAWRTCVETQKGAARVKGNQEEGVRRNVSQTPTFIIGSKQIAGSLSYDMFKSLVDSALGMVRADSGRPGAKGRGADKSAAKKTQ